MATYTATAAGSPISVGGLPAGNYTFQVAASNQAGVGPLSAATAAVAVAASSGGGTSAAGADWVSHFSSRTLFENDFYPVAGINGGKDPASNIWCAGTSNSFYPYTFFTDSTAPAGEYIRAFCDRISLHPADSGKVNGSPWIGCSGLTKRGFTSGYLEFAARFPSAGAGNGMWPAMWTYAQGNTGSGTDNTGPYTQSQSGGSGGNEIDLLEIFGNAKAMEYASTVHTPASQYGNVIVTRDTNKDTWHTWGLEWNHSVLNFFYDRVNVGSDAAEAHSFGEQLQARIDMVVMSQGSFGVGYDSTTPNSLFFDVSYVRHWASRPF